MTGLPFAADVTPRPVPSHTDRLTALDLRGREIRTGEVVALPPGRYDWLRLTLAASTPAEVTVRLYYAGGSDPEVVHVPAGDRVTRRVPVTRRDDLLGFRFGPAAAVTIHELSLVRPAAVTGRVLLEVAR